jgi:hypothetical protein
MRSIGYAGEARRVGVIFPLAWLPHPDRFAVDPPPPGEGEKKAASACQFDQ